MKLQLERLCRINLAETLELVLINLSVQGLSDMYAQSYQAILSEADLAKMVALRTISWLLCMQQPLEIEGLMGAIVNVLGRRRNRLEPRNILKNCHGLVIIDPISKTLKFVHLSIRDLLKTLEAFSEVLLHVQAAQDCLHACLQGPSLDDCAVGVEDDQLYRYAVLSWPSHLQVAGYENYTDELRLQIKNFAFGRLYAEAGFEFWLDEMSLEVEKLPETNPLNGIRATVSGPGRTSIFTGCVFGILELVEPLLTVADFDWSQLSEDGQSGLYLAARSNHGNLVDLLISRGCDLHAKGGRY